MITGILDKREVRSFRLRYFTLILSSFLTQKESFGLFMLCDTVQPKDRQNWAEEFNKKNLKATFISKNILKFLFKQKKWIKVKKLLEGGIVFLRDTTNKVIKKENLKFLFSEKKLYFRLIFWQYMLYRTYFMTQWLKEESYEIKSFFKIIKTFLFNKKTTLFLKI